MQEIRQRREEARRGIAYLRDINPIMWSELDQYLLKKYDAIESELWGRLYPRRMHMGSREFRALPYNPVAVHPACSGIQQLELEL